MRSKRSLGQNFFVNSNLADHIVNIITKESSNYLVEIGPGMGFFTERLMPFFKEITVVEKDRDLASNLKLQFPSINVVNIDFLDLDLDTLNPECLYFGSLPYNVSKPIIKKIIQSSNFSKKSYFIVQKEVAEKYIYKPPYSSLSLHTYIYADCKKILDISPHSFRPKPNVDSSLISFTPVKRDIKNIHMLEELIGVSFKQPRKNIFNNLRGSKYESGASKYKTYRPAQLDLDKYIEILNHSL